MIKLNKIKRGDIICHKPTGKIFSVYEIYADDYGKYYCYKNMFGLKSKLYFELECYKVKLEKQILGRRE